MELADELFVDDVQEAPRDTSTLLNSVEECANSPASEGADSEGLDPVHQTQGLLKEKNDLEEKEEGVELTEDIYSLLYACEPFSTPFFYALSCVLFQYVFISLVIVDVLDNSDSQNPFNLPPAGL